MCEEVNDKELASVMVSRTYKWSIDNFSKVNLKRYPLISDDFEYKFEDSKSEEQYASSWSLKLHADGFDDGSKGYVCFEIKLEDFDVKILKMQVDCKLSILKANNQETNSRYVTHHFDPDDGIFTRRLFRNFIKLDCILSPSNGLLTNDKLILLFSIGIQKGKSVISLEEGTYKSRLQLSDDLECFYNSKKLTDVTFIVGDKEFKANKSILAARSSVFLSMFSLDMKEKNEKSMKIDDVDLKAFKEMLKFIYTGKLHKYQFIDELLVVADKYAVEGLQKACENFLCNDIRIDNAMNILQLADFYNAFDLKHQAQQFIVDRALYIIETDGFKHFQQPQVHLIKELFCVLTNKYKDCESDDEEIRDADKCCHTV